MDSRPQVLIVEDQIVQAKLYQAILERGGCDASFYLDLGKFLTQFLYLDPPDLLLCDIVLEGDRTGLDLVKQLCTDPAWCQVPVILMSAEPTPEHLRTSMELAVPPEAFIVKPIYPAVLLQLVHAVLHHTQPIYELRGLQRERQRALLAHDAEAVAIRERCRLVQQELEGVTQRVADLKREGQTLLRSSQTVGGESASATELSTRREAVRVEVDTQRASLARLESEHQRLQREARALDVNRDQYLREIGERLRTAATAVRAAESGKQRAA